MERRIVFKALIGSKNYNLDIKSESDEDYRSLVMPSFDDLYDCITNITVNKKYYDVRELPDFFECANLNFLETLFSKDITGDNELIDYLKWHRFELSKIDLPDLYYLCINNSDYRKSKMLNQSEKGYDPKIACEVIRLLDFVIRLAKYDFNFEKALWYGNSPGNEIQRCFLINIKSGKYDVEEIYELINEYHKKAVQYKNLFVYQKINYEELDKLKNFIKNYIKRRIFNEV